MRGLSYFLFSLFLLSCSQELPLSSDSPSAAASKEANDAPEGSIAVHPAGKVTDADCPLCGFLGDDEHTIPEGQGGHTAPEEEEDEETEEEDEETEEEDEETEEEDEETEEEDEETEEEDENDRAALVALYEATGGDNWHSNSNWLSSAPLKDWYGVDTNSEGRVTKLWVHENGLRGWLPSALGNLEKLEELWLSGNQLSGSIPPQLGQLANLREVYIRWNRFTGCLPQAWQTIEENDFESVSLSFCGDTAGSSDSEPDSGPDPDPKPDPEKVGSSGAFQIELVYRSSISSEEKVLLRRAADQWEEAITGDLPDISFVSSPYDKYIWDVGMRVTVTDVVDDVRIFVGSGTFMGLSMAGRGGVISVRSEGKLPILSILDISPFLFGYDDDDLYRVMLHEIGHCLGFGIVWEDLELLQHNYFFGVMARRWFDVLGGSSYRGEKVPTEPGGGHWRTSVFGDELMTTRPVSPYRAPLSAITIASMNDIGYEVNLDVAEEYKVPSPSAAKPVADETWPGCQILHQSIDVVAEDGHILDTIDP